MTKQKIQYPGIDPDAKPMGTAPLSPALLAGPFVFTSGQVGIDPLTGKIVGEDIKSQTRQTILNIKALVEAAGLTLNDVVKTNVFLTDISDFSEMNSVYREFFAEPYPARSTVGIALNNPELKVEIEAIALRRE